MQKYNQINHVSLFTCQVVEALSLTDHGSVILNNEDKLDVMSKVVSCQTMAGFA